MPRNVQNAVFLFNVLGGHGITYAVDPSSSFATRKAGKNVDYVMFGRETLKKKAGDCDDLTVLYCSLLESIGIK